MSYQLSRIEEFVRASNGHLQPYVRDLVHLPEIYNKPSLLFDILVTRDGLFSGWADEATRKFVYDMMVKNGTMAALENGTIIEFLTKSAKQEGRSCLLVEREQNQYDRVRKIKGRPDIVAYCSRTREKIVRACRCDKEMQAERDALFNEMLGQVINGTFCHSLICLAGEDRNKIAQVVDAYKAFSKKCAATPGAWIYFGDCKRITNPTYPKDKVNYACACVKKMDKGLLDYFARMSILSDVYKKSPELAELMMADIAVQAGSSKEDIDNFITCFMGMNQSHGRNVFEIYQHNLVNAWLPNRIESVLAFKVARDKYVKQYFSRADVQQNMSWKMKRDMIKAGFVNNAEPNMFTKAKKLFADVKNKLSENIKAK